MNGHKNSDKEITIKNDRKEIKELLKIFLPRQVAKRLKISCKTVFDVIDSLNEEEKKKYNLKEMMHLEVISVQIRMRCKEALENGKTISYERLCKEYYVRTSFLIDLLGREERDY